MILHSRWRYVGARLNLVGLFSKIKNVLFDFISIFLEKKIFRKLHSFCFIQLKVPSQDGRRGG